RGLVAGSSAYPGVSNCVAEGSFNLGTYSTDLGGNADNLADAKVNMTLADNGGTTETHALESDSPAVDTGSNPSSLTFDQRGTGYNRVYGGTCDMGAYEYGSGPAAVSYASTEFVEAQANDGSIDNSTPITITLVADTFMGVVGEEFAAVNYTSGSIPSGLSMTMTNTSSTTLDVYLSGTATAHTVGDSVSDIMIMFEDAAFAGDSASSVLGYSNSTFEVTFGDSELTYDSSTFSEAAANDGTIVTEITGTLSYETFAQAIGTELVTTNVTPANVPAGLTASVKVASSTTVTVTLTGAADAHNVAENISTISLTFLDGAFSGGSAATVTGYAKTDFAVSYLDPALTYVNTDFRESSDNDGSMNNSVVVTLAGDDFASAVTSGGLVVGSVPAGLAASVVMDSTSQVTVSLIGNATSSDVSDNISNLSFTFGDSSFIVSDTSVVADAVKSDLTVTFIDALFVSQSGGSDTTGDGSSGNPYATIINTISHATAGGVIAIMDPIHTESNITVNVDDLVIVGQGADQTILQAATAMGLASNRIFTVSSSGLTLQDMTLRYGDVAGNGGVVEGGTSANGLTVERCSFEDNKASGVGGAIRWSYSPITIKDSTFTRNTAALSGGAIQTYDRTTSLYIENSTFSTNVAIADDGGAVYSDTGVANVTEIYNSSFINNHCGDGGTFDDGGAIYSHGYNATVESCLFAGNSTTDAGAGDDTDGHHVNYYNTVHEGTFVGTDMGGSISTNDAGVDMVLADNGGSTMTHALTSDSPAINAGSNPSSLSYDQRGIGYNRTVGVADCGAYEYGANPTGTLFMFK
ncbi:MAG: hypothetical protein KAI74_03805, partial [Kiritimatiellae bacterium]|nr:hypothetical protein [Kiritimatiellia bacterium]